MLPQLISVVKAVDAVTRIPEHRLGVTFFSEEDVWIFDATLDNRTCVLCRTAEEIREFRGNNLRVNFPYLEIIDMNTIYPNVHPNCRCVLRRLLHEYEPVTPKGV